MFSEPERDVGTTDMHADVPAADISQQIISTAELTAADTEAAGARLTIEEPDEQNDSVHVTARDEAHIHPLGSNRSTGGGLDMQSSLLSTGIPLQLDDEESALAKASAEEEAEVQAWSVRMEAVVAAKQTTSEDSERLAVKTVQDPSTTLTSGQASANSIAAAESNTGMFSEPERDVGTSTPFVQSLAGDNVIIAEPGTLGLALTSDQNQPTIDVAPVPVAGDPVQLERENLAADDLSQELFVSAPQSKQYTAQDSNRRAVEPLASLELGAHDTTESRAAVDRSSSRFLEVTFTEPGPLGIKFMENARSLPVKVQVKRINPDTQAELHPSLSPGLVLIAVGTVSVAGMSYRDVIDTIKAHGRPLTCCFGPVEPLPDRETSQPAETSSSVDHGRDAIMTALSSSYDRSMKGDGGGENTGSIDQADEQEQRQRADAGEDIKSDLSTHDGGVAEGVEDARFSDADYSSRVLVREQELEVATVGQELVSYPPPPGLVQLPAGQRYYPCQKQLRAGRVLSNLHLTVGPMGVQVYEGAEHMKTYGFRDMVEWGSYGPTPDTPTEQHTRLFSRSRRAKACWA
jgi:hypothetical protein